MFISKKLKGIVKKIFIALSFEYFHILEFVNKPP